MKQENPWISALKDPLNLAMAGLAIAAGLCGAWWLFPVGSLLWIVMVLIVARDPALLMNQRLGDREPLAQRFQIRFDRLQRAQVSLFNTSTHANRAMKDVLSPLQIALDSVVDEAYLLCRQMTLLENHRMVSEMNTDQKAALVDIEQKIQAATDSVVKREYEESARSLKGRLDRLQAVTVQLERTDAMLASLVSDVDGILTEAVRLQALGAQQARPLMPSLVQKAREEQAQLREFRQKVSGESLAGTNPALPPAI